MLIKKEFNILLILIVIIHYCVEDKININVNKDAEGVSTKPGTQSEQVMYTDREKLDFKHKSVTDDAEGKEPAVQELQSAISGSAKEPQNENKPEVSLNKNQSNMCIKADSKEVDEIQNLDNSTINDQNAEKDKNKEGVRKASKKRKKKNKKLKERDFRF